MRADKNRHRAHRPRNFEHRLAGGGHRKNDGCLGAALLIVGGGVATLVGAGAGIVALVEAIF
jgi:hypothetical protein